MANFSFLVGALLVLICLAVFARARFKWFNTDDQSDLFRELEHIARDKTYRLVYRFENSPYWLLLERKPENGAQVFTLCVPRPGFDDDDFTRLEEMFSEHGFRFERGCEMARFAARVPLSRDDESIKPSTNMFLAVRIFMRALEIPSTTRFKRAYEIGS